MEITSKFYLSEQMGELTRFDNVRIYMNYMDTDRHQEPHFHIELSDGKEASISIAMGKILAGRIDKKIFDVKPYLQYDVFKPINNLDEFKNVYIEFGTVCWKCGADLSRDTLYIKSYEYDKQSSWHQMEF